MYVRCETPSNEPTTNGDHNMTYSLKIYMKSGAIIELDKVESCDIDFNTENLTAYPNQAYSSYSPISPQSLCNRSISNFVQSGSARNLIELETLDLNEVVAIVRVY
jgi:hypothetical protein